MNNNTTVTDGFAAARAYIHEILQKNSNDNAVVMPVAKITTVVRWTGEVVAFAESSAVPELEQEEYVENQVDKLAADSQKIQAVVEAAYDNLFEIFAESDFEESVEDLDLVPEEVETKLEPENYEGDDEAFRCVLNYSVDQIKNVVPAWGGNRSFVFIKLYNCMSEMLSKALDTKVDFRKTYFDKQFIPYVKKHKLEPPVDIWRRINLCAASQIWKDITIAAFRKLTAVAIRDEARRRYIDPKKALEIIERKAK